MSPEQGTVGRDDQASPGFEKLVFLVTCFIAIPGFAVAFVALYGFAIWISQIIGGPPTAP